MISPSYPGERYPKQKPILKTSHYFSWPLSFAFCDSLPFHLPGLG